MATKKYRKNKQIPKRAHALGKRRGQPVVRRGLAQQNLAQIHRWLFRSFAIMLRHRLAIAARRKQSTRTCAQGNEIRELSSNMHQMPLSCGTHLSFSLCLLTLPISRLGSAFQSGSGQNMQSLCPFRLRKIALDFHDLPTNKGTQRFQNI